MRNPKNDRTELKVGMILHDLDPRHPNRRGWIIEKDATSVLVRWDATMRTTRLSMKTAQERFEVVPE
jgi:hypothetical protein